MADQECELPTRPLEVPGDEADPRRVWPHARRRERDSAGPTLVVDVTEVLPQLVGQIYTWHTNAPYIDVGTPQSLQEARSIWPDPDGNSQ